MIYQGSKRRLAKHFVPIFEQFYTEGLDYVEPFVGGANMIDKVPFPNRYGYDSNCHVIKALEIIRDTPEILPKDATEFTREDYKSIAHDDELYGYAMVALSYGAKWRGGYAGVNKHSNNDYISAAYRNAVKQSPLLKNIYFECKDYRDIQFDKRSLIYCDPPYANTTKYKDDFNHDEFWKWCEQKANEGHIVLVSEYTAPKDYHVLFEKELNVILNDNSQKATEKLFLV